MINHKYEIFKLRSGRWLGISRANLKIYIVGRRNIANRMIREIEVRKYD